MANLFKNNTQTQPVSERQQLENRYNSARYNLLLVVVFTVINIVLLIAQSDTYFLFSASIPFVLVDFGMLFSGMYPAEVYVGDYAGLDMFDQTFFIVTVVIAAIIVGFYLLSWIMSKKQRVGWIVFALVLFGIDTLAMLGFYGISIDIIIDILFHAWVLYYLINGIVVHNKLKKLPPEEELTVATGENEEIEDSVYLRYADTMEKHRVLAEAEANGYKIIYRRVGKVNELVINGRVYDEYTALIEMNHTLNARIDGRTIAAGYNGSHSYITVDGQEVAKKLRIY